MFEKLNERAADRRIFIIADTHFGDENIRHYEVRPFRDAEAMDRELIRRWNESVGEEDIVYHLGDFCSSDTNMDRCRELTAQLKGHKRLVLGNHDRHFTAQEWRDAGFEECYDIPVILDGYFILSHEPLYICRSMPYANLFGHVHNGPSFKSVSSRSACVSVERTGYKPVLLNALRDMMKDAERREDTDRQDAVSAADGWIPVSVKLPEESENPVTKDYNYYMCTYHDGDVYDVRPYKYGSGHFWNGPGIVDDHVTAWQERPAPYKGKKESVPVSWIKDYLNSSVQSDESRYGIILMLGTWKEEADACRSADNIPMDWIRRFYDRTVMSESACSGLLIMLGNWGTQD